MEFDESEWVVAGDANGNDVIDIGDWVVTDGDEGGVAGVLFHSPRHRRRPFYASFKRSGASPEPSLSFLPANAAALSSSRGLLLLLAPWSAYYVADPAAALCRPIPRPPKPHSSPSPALVAGKNAGDFHLVCALAVSGDDAAVYRFEVFSSVAGVWRDSAAGPVVAGAKIVPGSGVAASGIAYWRTTAPAVVAYDPVADQGWIVPAPPACAESGDRWQLGVALAGGGICCACVTAEAVVLYGLSGGEWSELGSVSVAVKGGGEAVEWESGDPIACVERPWPLRFESTNLEVVLWVDGRVVAVDLESQRLRAVKIEWSPVNGGIVDHVSCIGSLVPVAPVGSN